MVGIADTADARCPCPLCEPCRCIDVAHTAVLEQEVLTGLEHLGQVQLFLLYELMVQVQLVAIVRLDILPLAVDGHEVHIEQGCTTVNL